MSTPYSRKIARESGSNFYFSFFFLPPRRRDALMAIYAFSRLVDDAVDQAATPEEGKASVDLWKKRLDACFGKQPEDNVLISDPEVAHPLLSELKWAVEGFQIPKEYFQDLLAGVEMDLGTHRYETFEELEKYCYHVAGTIGLLCNRIFGLDSEEARRYAILLGTAFQLTNILRDVRSDAQRGRLYLPVEDLRRYGVSEASVLAGEATPVFLQLMNFEAARARDYFARAEAALPHQTRRKLLTAEVMSVVYQRILKRLQKENFPVFEKKMALPGWEKVALILKTMIKAAL